MATKTKKTKDRPKVLQDIDYTYDAQFTAGAGAFQAASLAAGGVMATAWLDAPWWASVTACAALAAGNGLLALNQRRIGDPHRVKKNIAGVWAVWAAEVGAANLTDPNTWGTGDWWTAGSIYFTTWALSYFVLDRADKLDEAQNRDDLGYTPASRKRLFAGKWDATVREWIDRVGRYTDIKLYGQKYLVKEWPSHGDIESAGYSILFTIPEGKSIRTLDAGICSSMADEAGLPHGATVSVSPGPVRGQFWLEVATRNTDDDVYVMPRTFKKKSINDKVTFGFSPRGLPMISEIRESNVFICSPAGGGKTTLLNSILVDLCRCDDVLIWGIDVAKKMESFAAWREDLPEGVDGVFDNEATTVAEAAEMLDQALRIQEARLAAAPKAQKNLLKVSHSIPQIVIVIDEGAEFFKEPELLKRFLEVCNVARAMGIRFIFTTVDARLSTIIDRNVLKASDVRIGLTRKDPTGEAVDALFEGLRRTLDYAQMTAPGSSAMLMAGSSAVLPARTWYTPDEVAEECLTATASFRPRLDPVSVSAAGESYARRWDKTYVAGPVARSVNEAAAGGSDDYVSGRAGGPTPLPGSFDPRSGGTYVGSEAGGEFRSEIGREDLDVEAAFKALTEDFEGEGREGRERGSEGGYSTPDDLFDDE